MTSLLQGIVQKYELNRKWFYLYGEHSLPREHTDLHLAEYLAVMGAYC